MSQRAPISCLAGGVLTLILFVTMNNLYSDPKYAGMYKEMKEAGINLDKSFLNEENEKFNDFDNEFGMKNGCYIVPNYIHFLRFDQEEVTFVDAVCILAALKNQKPEKIFIHTNKPTFTGKYWKMLLKNPIFSRVLHIVRTEIPEHIFGQTFNTNWRNYHAGDITRLRILMKYGGVFLDNDSYMVKSINDFRKYEMTLGWMENSGLANQAIIANKKARFLKLWYESYHEYDSSQWYYNAGIKPTKEILEHRPYLIHREKILLCNHHIVKNLYEHYWPEWSNHYVIHLLNNHQYLLKNVSEVATYPVIWNENNIQNYPVTFREMVYKVFPFDEFGINITKT